MTEFAYRLDISTEGALKVDLDEYFADKADQDIMKRSEEHTSELQSH